MAKKTSPLLPSTDALLQQFGERLRLARLRRGLSAKQVCERAGMAVMTLRGLERGGSGVTIGAYLAVMQVLGIEQDLQLLGQADSIGRSLQDARLPQPRVVKKAGKKTRPDLYADQAEMVERTDSGSITVQQNKARAPGYAEMARLAGGGTALEAARKALGPDLAEMARLAGGGTALEAARKALGPDLAEMARLAGGGTALEAARKVLGPDLAEMTRLANGGSAQEVARKALGMDYAEMARLASGGSALEAARKALGPDLAEMARLTGGGSAADELRKMTEAAKTSDMDWANSGQLLSSDMLAQLITPSKKEK
jgi:transcriptional regulator with XRE-family HTH domain